MAGLTSISPEMVRFVGNLVRISLTLKCWSNGLATTLGAKSICAVISSAFQEDSEVAVGVFELTVIVAMIAFNSVFAAYELALAAVSLARLRILASENRRGANAALYMKENVEASLAAIQLGITLFGAIAAATGGAGADEEIAPWLQRQFAISEGWAEFLAVTAIVIPLTALTITFGELVPKIFALRNKEWVCLALSPLMRWFTFSVWPAVRLFEIVVSAITDWGQRRFRESPSNLKSDAAEMQELQAVATLVRTSRLIGHREEGIIHSAARFSSRQVQEIMLPAADISMLNATGSLADALIAAHLDMHTRFPVTERPSDPQGIVGYVNLKDIVAVMRLSPEEPTLRGIIRPLMAFEATVSIANCLERLLLGSAHIALVRDGRDKVIGMVTLEDIVEELLGDIKDEYDRPHGRLSASGRGWVVGGGISLARLREATGIDLTTDRLPHQVISLGDWIAAHLGRTPRGGDLIEQGGVRVSVRKIRRRQVLEAQVYKLN